MTTVLLVIHFFIAALLVITILVQRSEGGALGGLSGGSGSGLMSARGTANLLTRATGFLAAGFFMSSLLIAILLRSPDGGHSILDMDEKRTEKNETTKPVESAALVAPAPHTEGESTLTNLPATASTQPSNATEPAKGVDAVDPKTKK